MIRAWRTVTLLAATMWAVASLGAEATDWPQEVKTSGGTVVIYQPQPESLEGNILSGRAAMSLEIEKKEPIFGAFWFTAKIDTDKDDGITTVRDVHVTKVRWPDMKDGSAEKFTKVVEGAVPTAGYKISTERLSASLATTQREQKSLAELKNDPPKIVFSDQLAVLLMYDGAPKFVPVENSTYERAVNTPFAVARNTKSKHVYLSSGTLWYQADDPLGPWLRTTTPPADIIKMLPAADSKEAVPTKIPGIVVATTPTELIATDGKPEWTSLTGGKILYVKNTETPWLRELTGTDMYVLLSGRWFRAATAAGPWTFVRPDKLPESFKEIPPDSDISGLRVSVAGTDEANNAMLDAQIPQTSAIKRNEAKLEVHYDGAPKFEKIAGTSVSYAVNTNAQVLQIDGRYYAVDSGVWFTGAAAKGPWAVADKIPQQEIAKIPPSSPMYNTTYVHIYESTPQVVYVGYTPGYMWSYPYYGVPVYGTGWYYPPYWGAVYYPRPPTWGMHVGYNPWTGWSYGVSWSNGFMSVGIGWHGGYPYRPPYCCGGGWYGGGYHHSTVIINTGNINIGNTVNIHNRNTINHNNVNINNSRNNLYKQSGNVARNADRATAQQNLKPARPATGRENNVYADRNGNLAQRSGDQWQTRDQGAWKNDQTRQAAQDRTPSQSNQQRQSVDRSEFNNAYQSRQSGTSREMSRPMHSGGGGRRR
jgi:hypothetical protein